MSFGPSAAIYVYPQKKKRKEGKAILLHAHSPTPTYVNKLSQPKNQKLRMQAISPVQIEKQCINGIVYF